MAGWSPGVPTVAMLRWCALAVTPALTFVLAFMAQFAEKPMPDFEMAAVLGVGILVSWLVCFELPMRLWWWRCKRGLWLSRRERTTERVYELLSLGSPLGRRSGVVRV